MASPKRATILANSSATPGWSTFCNERQPRDTPRPRPHAGLSRQSSPTNTMPCRTTPPSCSPAGPTRTASPPDCLPRCKAAVTPGGIHGYLLRPDSRSLQPLRGGRRRPSGRRSLVVELLAVGRSVDRLLHVLVRLHRFGRLVLLGFGLVVARLDVLHRRHCLLRVARVDGCELVLGDLHGVPLGYQPSDERVQYLRTAPERRIAKLGEVVDGLVD